MPVTPESCDRIAGSVSRLVRTGRHISARMADGIYGQLRSFGWALLVPLEREGDLRTSVLAARAGVDLSVASRQIAVLESGGYVERRPDPRDGRACLIHLTDAGADALAVTRARRAEWAAEALDGWTEDDARRLGELLERLVVDLAAAAAGTTAFRVPSAAG